MNIKKMKPDSLKEFQGNVKVHGEKQVQELAKSLEQFGQIRPVIVDESNVILCGHGLVKAAIKLGYKEIEVMVMKGLDEKQKKKLLLADNKLADLGTYDYDAIDEIINSLDGDFDIPGFDADTLEEMYGVSSIDEEETGTVLSMPVEGVKTPTPDHEPNQRTMNSVEQKREEVEQVMAQEKKYVLCPNCGQRIDIDEKKEVS